MWRNKQPVDQSSYAAAPVQPAVARRWRLPKTVAVVLAAVLVFAVGVGVGNGSIQFRRSSSPAASSLPAQLDYSSVNKVYDVLRDNYNGKLTSEQLINGLKAGLANATNDPYTEYFTAKEAKTFDDQLNQSFSGIGAELSKDSDGNLTVVAPISGFPADKAGVRARDIIINVNGQSTSGMSIDEAVSKIRGKVGTDVKLDVLRNKSERLSLTITRQNITVPSVTTDILDGNIGYIRISTFGDDTAKLMDQATDKMKAAHVKGIILDLRDNPGGLLDAAISVSSHWLPEGKMVLQEKRGSTVVQTYNSNGSNQLSSIKTVVLINEGSASASEITAGALHDNHAATLIGVKSFGKGVVQQLIPFSDGSELKVTVASWYRPNGQNINKKGIQPDQTVKLSSDDITAKNDVQKTAAIDFLTK